ncbi:MAG: MATE family efflux transporter [Clostridia bacterium]|nr:MATE family efflux transporter [Clostridia bacterium]
MKRLSEKNIDLILRGSLPRAVLAIALPVVMSSFLQTMYNLTDTYWLGQIGKEPLAAINLVSPVQSMVVSFGSGLTVAGSVLISQLIGAGRRRDAAKMLSQLYACALIFSVTCAAAVALLTPALVGWLGAEGPTARYAVDYLRLVICDMPFLFTLNIYQSSRQAQGDTVRPMLLNLLGILINMALDPLLMVTLGLEATGAALATLAAKAVPACAALYGLTDRKAELRVERKLWKPEGDTLRKIVRIGLPTAVGGSAMQLGFLLMSRSVLAYGTNAMAAYGIGNKVNGLISLPSNGVGSAVATIAGQNIGANQPERADRGFRVSAAGITLFLLIGGFIVSRPAVSTALVSLFSTDPNVIALAADFLSLMAFWCWCNGVYNCATGLFQGAGHTEVTMLSDAARLWVYRFATLWFCSSVLHLGVRSVWLSVVISNAIAAAVMVGMYFSGRWRRKVV